MSKIKLLKNLLLQLVNDIDTGNTNISEDAEEEIIDLVTKLTRVESKYSKYQACEYLGLSRATFDRYIKDGIIPAGRKESGFKELFYYKKDLDDAKNKILNLRNSRTSNT